MEGLEISRDPITPTSTGAVAFDPGPVTTHFPVDNSSTGAVVLEQLPPSATVPVRAAEPIETKVIAPPAKPAAKPKTTATTK